MIRGTRWLVLVGLATAWGAREARAQEPASSQPADDRDAQASEARSSLTLEQVVRTALARNERSRIAAIGITSAEAAVRKARAGFLPSITLGATETLRPYSEEQNGRTTLRSNALSGTLTVSQPLLAVSAFPAYSAAKHGAEAARWDAVDQRRQLSFDAAKAFFAVIAAQRVLKAAERRQERADASFADTKARAEAQMVSINDVTRARRSSVRSPCRASCRRVRG